jgi:hypothetical protein
LYKVFAPAEARRILKKLDLQYAPKHGSWLNIAEFELSAFSRQCMNRRIPDILRFQRAGCRQSDARNDQALTVVWQFTTVGACIKLKQLCSIIQF